MNKRRGTIGNKDAQQMSKVSYRINPSGQKEQIVSRHDDDQETLSELMDEIGELIESIEQANVTKISAEGPNPYGDTGPRMVGSKHDSVRNAQDTITNLSGSTPLANPLDGTDGVKGSAYQADRGKNIPVSPNAEDEPKDFVRMESCTSTAGIAIAPAMLDVPSSNRQRARRKIHKTKPGGQWEHTMRSDIERLLNEWEPEFVAGQYDPGEPKMNHLGGEGVAGRRAKPGKGGHSAVDKNHGDAFGAGHNETAAMCDVEESGVEDKPQGSHESSVGDPLSDNCCDEVGHNWPDQPKHKGASTEPLEGSRYTDGGVLHGSQMEWSPAKIGKLMGEDANLQKLFDSYARASNVVDLQSFTSLCEAHGHDFALDESSLLRLMSANRSYVFHEARDADGSYWIKEASEDYEEYEFQNAENTEPEYGEGVKVCFTNYRELATEPAREFSQEYPNVDYYLRKNPDHAVTFTYNGKSSYVMRGASEHADENLDKFYYGLLPAEDPGDAYGGDLDSAEASDEALGLIGYGIKAQLEEGVAKRRGRLIKEDEDFYNMADDAGHKPHSVTIDGVEYVPANDQDGVEDVGELEDFGEDGPDEGEMPELESDDEMGGCY